MKLKTFVGLLGLLMLGQFNLVNAQSNTQKETTYVGDQKNGQPDGKGVLTDTIEMYLKAVSKKVKKKVMVN